MVQVGMISTAFPRHPSKILDSVPKPPPKLVKEILSGEFMKLSELLPKNFNSLQPLHDEPLTLTLENSVIVV